MSNEQQTKTLPEQPQINGELNDSQLEKVSAGSRPNCATPLDSNDPKASDNFARRN
ncbi:hypothetical protein DLREEDagrD3_11520 [Denitratisoma sp. agr-D3]